MSELAEVVPELAPDQIPEGWSKIASAYERTFEQLTEQLAHEALRQLDIKPGDRVLDVAAGTGAFSLAAAQAGAQVLATDFAPGMISLLNKRISDLGLKNIDTQVMDGQNLQVTDASYDVSISIVGLIFFPDIEKGLTELRRVLKPGGRGVVVCWDEVEKFQMMQYLLRAIKNAVPEFEVPATKPVWARLSGPQQLQQAMTSAGYNDVTVTSMSGVLEIESLPDFWNDFAVSTPPLAKLFSSLGEANTRKVGDAFIELIEQDSDGAQPRMIAPACIGVGRV